MIIEGKKEVLEVLGMPEAQFEEEVAPEAAKLRDDRKDGSLLAMAMLGYDNVCKNQCLYCGMRASNSGVKRYRLAPEDVIASARMASENGFRHIFLVSGEDPKYGFDNLLHIVEAIHEMGMHQSLACGEYSPEQYRELKSAGAEEYVMKFEMSDEETFNRLNPSTNFKKRMSAIESVKASGMKLASGNIVGFPGQSCDQLAEDILLMKKLEISWAPVIPYMPAQNTPLAAEGGVGDLLTNRKEIALLRLMMPDVNITAQQPGKDLRNGLADPQGNRDAILSGANVLFCDLLPDALAKNFRVIDNRNVSGTEHLYQIAELTGLALSF